MSEPKRVGCLKLLKKITKTMINLIQDGESPKIWQNIQIKQDDLNSNHSSCLCCKIKKFINHPLNQPQPMTEPLTQQASATGSAPIHSDPALGSYQPRLRSTCFLISLCIDLRFTLCALSVPCTIDNYEGKSYKMSMLIFCYFILNVLWMLVKTNIVLSLLYIGMLAHCACIS